MHILFLSDNFPPEFNAPASRTFEHAREWVRAGHKVSLITCHPNFPGGKVFAGHKNTFFKREQIEGIDVIRVWSYITANEGFLKRTLDYVSYMIAATLASPMVKKPDIIVATSPQFFTALAGYIVSKMKRIPFVFELRDIWPESIRAVDAMKTSVLLDWLEKLELFLYRKAKLIISVTNAFKDNLAKRGIDKAKIEVVTNGVDLSKFSRTPKDKDLLDQLGLRGKFIAGYVGTIGMAHALECIIEAGQILKGQKQDDIHFLVLGEGANKAKLKQEAFDRGLTNVTFLDSVPKDEVATYWSILDVSIIHLKKTDLFKSVIPSKLFECMAMGLPVLHGVMGESAAIVTENAVGECFEPENSIDLSKKLLELKNSSQRRKQYSDNGLKTAIKYDRKVLAAQMLKHLKQATEA